MMLGFDRRNKLFLISGGLIPLGLNDFRRGLLHASQFKHNFAMIGASKLRRVRVFFP